MTDTKSPSELEASLAFVWDTFTDDLLLSRAFWKYFIIFGGLQIVYTLFFRFSGLFDANIDFSKFRKRPWWPAVAGNHLLSLTHGTAATVRSLPVYLILNRHQIINGCGLDNYAIENDITAMNSGYFMADTIYVLIYEPEVTFIIHHIVCVWGAITMLQLNRCGHLWMHLCFFGEGTTPLLQVSWFARSYYQINPHSLRASYIADGTLAIFVLIFLYTRGVEMTRTALPAGIKNWSHDYPQNLFIEKLFPTVICLSFVFVGYIWAVFGLTNKLWPICRKYCHPKQAVL